MRILALNPYHTGSHKAFLEGWMAHSRHDFETLTLPGHHWKWRMRHAGATFAAELLSAKPQAALGGVNAVWCTSMLDLASFYGLCDHRFRSLPAMVYFHENQLTYPTRHDDPRDQHFAITHLTSALAAIQRAPGLSPSIGWNSAYHRDGFLTATSKLLQKMPGRELDHLPDMIHDASVVLSPGVQLGDAPDTVEATRSERDELLHILWVGRWEHDKDPDAFFAALKKLKKRGVRFRLSVLGESFKQVPECFATAKKRFADEIVRWGYQDSRAEYEAALREADVVVSTARHEFFGIAVVEAVAAGCFPVFPHRLAYPEVFGEDERFYYDGTPDGLADHLMRMNVGDLPGLDHAVVERYRWEHAAERLDAAMARLGGGHAG
ncbi:tRNA-queuosine alpha-mannosyltransferase domain-containing protein [Algisphaera agarilytica]|uniref:tRNA-queuosine alpha-mannosyltransferase n=1 Tax=Algisphaera agarilytica TaxID=1385975 RepID=A0A7X0H5G6_9BACT|nr:DUF3524 domain-containing protein [Algisphaera agarilytica]MBB6429642.1 glycosyltransferase involved in cell wall biosynthesis [Algisphaera agarilytica]